MLPRTPIFYYISKKKLAVSTFSCFCNKKYLLEGGDSFLIVYCMEEMFIYAHCKEEKWESSLLQ